MAHEQERVRALYRKLLGLYPRAFRERLAVSMEQTFNDLYNERKRQARPGLFGFVLWMFAETAAGIVRERVLQFRQGTNMRNLTASLRSASLRSAALISFLLVLPFALLEFAYTRGGVLYNPPLALYIMLWLLTMAFMLTLTPTVRSLRAGSGVLANPTALLFVLLRVAFLAILVILWGGIIADQFPCFLGVPTCD